MATFIELKTEVLANVIDTPTAIQTYVGTYVNRALKKIQVKHDFKCMEAEVTFTTVNLTRSLGDRPTDWKKPRGNPYFIYNLGGTQDMQFVSSRTDAQARWGTSVDFDYGAPQGLYEDDLASVFAVYPFPDLLSDYPDGNYRVTVPYWKFIGKLISDNDENWLTINAEQWIIYQATAEAFYVNEDETRGQLWEARAAKEYKDVILHDKDRRWAETTSLVMHLGARKPHTQE